METRFARSGWNMQAGGIVSLKDAERWEIVLEQGRAWLTVEGYSQDKWLGAGERFVIPDGGHVVLEAQGESRFRLEPPPAGALSRIGTRVIGALAGTVRVLAGTSVYSPERRVSGA
ncbi:DUF2917 domain-containing protein [Azoarcus sp. KH32C]|uniref:DUF2917 domain-containing protein n=1 Tax=Azoarcus sp. KH32C TaxID=748247 RepID=UPI0002386245|nr:DUF2917 domain-containing protein [Azoarcus sp. KH32C]BAL23538.1 hypothetical protein AZKH_1209 [Azoarcus sp. KH32C]